MYLEQKIVKTAKLLHEQLISGGYSRKIEPYISKKLFLTDRIIRG